MTTFNFDRYFAVLSWIFWVFSGMIFLCYVFTLLYFSLLMFSLCYIFLCYVFLCYVFTLLCFHSVMFSLCYVFTLLCFHSVIFFSVNVFSLLYFSLLYFSLLYFSLLCFHSVMFSLCYVFSVKVIVHVLKMLIIQEKVFITSTSFNLNEKLINQYIHSSIVYGRHSLSNPCATINIQLLYGNCKNEVSC